VQAHQDSSLQNINSFPQGIRVVQPKSGGILRALLWGG
jgi:phage baseplate assembly protein W